MKKLILLLFISGVFAACKKEKSNQPDYFIFGRNSDFCIDDCSKFFLIINGKIYPDSTSGLVLPLVFSTVPLTLTKYNLALPLLINFPAYLTNHANATFGCPQCIDQGIIYIERRDNGVKTVWRIDPILDSIPVQIQPYIQSMTMIVGQL